MAAGIKVAGYNIKIFGDSDVFVKAIGAANRATQNWSKSLGYGARQASLFGRAMSGLKGVLAGVGLGLGGFFGVRGLSSGIQDAISETLRFENVLSQSLSIVSNVTDEVRESYRDMAIEVSRSTRFTAVEAAQGFFYLASAGYDMQQQLDALPEAAYFAQAGLLSLEESVSLLADSQAAMGLKSQNAYTNLENLKTVSDQITRANILSNATIQEFARALQNKVAATARLARRPLEEVLGGLAAFADQGIKGRVAGNRLNIVLRELQAKAIKNAEAFRKMNVQVFDAAGELRALPEILKDFENLFAGVSSRTGRSRFLSLGLTREATDSLLQLVGKSSFITRTIKQIRDGFDSTEDIARRSLHPLVREINFLIAEFRNLQFSTRKLFPAFTEFVIILKNVFRALGEAANSARDFNDFWTQIEKTVFPNVKQIMSSVGVIIEIAWNNIVRFLLQRLSNFIGRSEALTNSPLFGSFFKALKKDLDEELALLDDSAAGFRDRFQAGISDLRVTRGSGFWTDFLNQAGNIKPTFPKVSPPPAATPTEINAKLNELSAEATQDFIADLREQADKSLIGQKAALEQEILDLSNRIRFQKQNPQEGQFLTEQLDYLETLTNQLNEAEAKLRTIFAKMNKGLLVPEVFKAPQGEPFSPKVALGPIESNFKDYVSDALKIRNYWQDALSAAENTYNKRSLWGGGVFEFDQMELDVDYLYEVQNALGQTIGKVVFPPDAAGQYDDFIRVKLPNLAQSFLMVRDVVAKTKEEVMDLFSLSAADLEVATAKDLFKDLDFSKQLADFSLSGADFERLGKVRGLEQDARGLQSAFFKDRTLERDDFQSGLADIAYKLAEATVSAPLVAGATKFKNIVRGSQEDVSFQRTRREDPMAKLTDEATKANKTLSKAKDILEKMLGQLEKNPAEGITFGEFKPSGTN